MTLYSAEHNGRVRTDQQRVLRMLYAGNNLTNAAD
jgi:hypothetical protein